MMDYLKLSLHNFFFWLGVKLVVYVVHELSVRHEGKIVVEDAVMFW